MDCIFCKIIGGSVPSNKIWENENFFAFLDIKPLQKGHILLVPKKHVEEVFDLPQDLYTELFAVAKKLTLPLRQTMRSKKIGLVVEGFGVAHTHLHLIPINNPHELNPEKAYSASKEELLSIQNLILDMAKEIK